MRWNNKAQVDTMVIRQTVVYLGQLQTEEEQNPVSYDNRCKTEKPLNDEWKWRI